MSLSAQERADETLVALGRLISGLHVPRSMGSVMLAVAQQPYDDVRHLINDFGWSSADEVTARLRAVLGATRIDPERLEKALIDEGWYIEGVGVIREAVESLLEAAVVPHVCPPSALDLSVAMNKAQIQPDEIRLGHDLLPVAERIHAALRRSR